MSVPTIITTGPENDKPDSRTSDPVNLSPPSPTLSNVDHRFDTTTTLRSNHPTAQSGAKSLELLTPHGLNHRGDGSSHSAETEPATPLSPAQTGTTALDSSSEKVAHIDPSQDHTDPTPFGFQPIKLASLVDPKSLESLIEMGGIDAIIKGLGTHRTRGLSSQYLQSEESSHVSHTAPPTDLEKQHPTDDTDQSGGAATASLADRHRVYGANVLPTRASKSLLYLMWLALKDKVLVLLCVAAVISLALGLYSDFGTERELIACADSGLKECYAPQVEWVEGVAIMVAVVIVVVVGSLNDWQKERQFRALNDKKEDRTVKVIRDGAEKVINIRELVVGDVALLEPGEIVPVDGIFLRGHNVKCDESGATGESDAIKKSSYEDCLEEKNAAKPGDRLKKDCYLISGAKVLEGVGEYVVIAVGQKSFNGRILMALRGDTESTPLQLKLNALAGLIAILGSIAGGVLFFALMIRFFVNLAKKPNRTANEKAMNFVDILIISVTVIVVAVPEGLPLAVTLALAFATKRMTGQNLLVRVLGSCETMANASVVCTDKTGTLTTNVMTVIAGSVGVHAKFAMNLEEHNDRTNVDKVEDESDPKGDSTRHRNDFSVDMQELGSALSNGLKKVFNEGIAVNSTAFEDKDPISGELEFVGSKTETALLRFAKDQGWADYKSTRESAEIVQMIPFSSERKCMGVVVKVGNKYRLHLKGASEILSNKCTRHVVVHKSGAPSSVSDEVVETKDLEEVDRVNINRTIIFYANRSLRTIAVCYREFESWPPRDFNRAADADNNDVPLELLLNDLTMIAITAIEDPLRPGVREAVANCARAGVVVKMCTGDNVLTARSIARQCGIFTPGGIVMEGPVFRKLSDKEMTEIVPRLQVLARSSPEDKKILVEKLKSLGEIVGVTGDGTNDGPALKTANVGFSMGIAGTEVAKEASDIILMDDNFASIVSAIKWGRCVNDAVRKFLQFQISVNITAVVITFVSAVASDEEESVLTAVQLLWINIIMDTFAALALATDPAADEMLDRKPDRITAPLFNTDMRKQIIGQSIYQTAVILIFHFLADQIFGYDKAGKGEAEITQWHAEMKTLVFNAFVFAQIFNSINSRRIDQKKNVFAGIHRNWYFILITLLEIGIQVLICFVGGDAFSVSDMSGRSWGVSIALGFVSLPLGFLIRCIPNPPIERFFIKVGLMKNPEVLPTQSPEKEEWNQAIDKVRDDLRSFANIRGGRVRASSFVRKSRSQRLADAGVQLPSLLAMVPTLVMSSIGAGWQPQRGDLSNPAGSDPSKSSTALFEGKIQMHPETPADDPFFAKYGPRKSQDV